MQARITREGDGERQVTVVHLTGRVDVETAQPFREACLNHLQNKKVVFDFRGLSFVGSSGILPFLETMQNFARLNAGQLRFSGVGVEYKKVFSATPLSFVDIFETPIEAAHALLHPPEAPVAAIPVPLEERAPGELGAPELSS